ncbi:response regulator [Flavobacterium myungsuense]|uniref:Response regulator n=1 Tax=Flavobacterium myungsuense TaxID=651823 RepID=A0ABW3J4Z0_9FLAO
MPKNIVICDDHILFSSGLFEILKKFEEDYTILTFNDSKSCKTYILQNKVDVFICDLNIDNVDGFILIQELKDALKDAKIIILTAYYENFLIKKAQKLGIDAFLRKETSLEELVDVIESEKNTPFYTNKNNIKTINEFDSKDESTVNKFRLSKQEKEIIKFIVEGKTSKEIAKLLFITKNTVDTHRKNIGRKLEINNNSSLIKFANENNLFS